GRRQPIVRIEASLGRRAGRSVDTRCNRRLYIPTTAPPTRREEAAFFTVADRPLTLKQLKYLIGIVDSGLNITAAAERLYTSQPGISKQLKQLEAELGVQLFTRKGKSLAAVTP